MKRFLYLLPALLLSTATHAQRYEVDTVKWMGNTDDYINIVFLGDGYLAEELNDFVADVNSSVASFFNIEPWKQYVDYFNVFLIKTPSAETGAGLSPSTPVNNFYGTTFGYGGTDRLLYPPTLTKVRTVLSNNFPNSDITVMIVNSTKYGGAGGNELMTFSKYKDRSDPRSDSEQIFFHEIGHGFAGLADEYWAGDNYAYEKPNMTKTSDPTTVKWKNWVGTDQVGVYPYSESPTWYRPHQRCRMRYLGYAYCDVCRQQIVESIHNLVNPINQYQPASDATIETSDDYIDFALTLIKPQPNTLDVTWKKNNVEESSHEETNRVYITDIPVGTTFNVTATVEDKSSMLRVDDHSNTHAYTVTWTVKRTGISTGIEQTSYRTDFTVGPLPFNEQLTVTAKGENYAGLNVQLANMGGMTVAQATTKADGQVTLNTASLPKGVYMLQVNNGNTVVYSKKIVKK